MPRKPKRPCQHPGCPKLTDGQFCDDHKAIERRRYNKYQRDPDYAGRYGIEWKRIRARYVKAHPLCEECFKVGIYKAAEEVHHILPLADGGTSERSNLISLCRSCHMKAHEALGTRHRP